MPTASFEPNEQQVVKQFLLDKGVLPEQLEDTPNPWLCLTKQTNSGDLYNELKTQGMLPTRADLAQTYKDPDNTVTNAWFWLSLNDEKTCVISDLIDKEVLPTNEDLSLICVDGPYKGINSWFNLASTDAGNHIMRKLISKGVLPARKDLAHIKQRGSTNRGKNCWFVLASDAHRLNIMRDLMNAGVAPNYNDLTKFFPDGNTLEQILISTSMGRTLLTKLYEINNVYNPLDGYIKDLQRDPIKIIDGYTYSDDLRCLISCVPPAIPVRITGDGPFDYDELMRFGKNPITSKPLRMQDIHPAKDIRDKLQQIARENKQKTEVITSFKF